MQVFDVYTYNLKQIRFKDNKDYFDCLLSELALKYSDVGFCFNSDPDGTICDRVIKQFPNLSKYKKYMGESEIYHNSAPQYSMSSISVNDAGIINLYIDKNNINDFCELMKKVPRPFNFAFMGVILDNIDWSIDSKSTPYLKPDAMGNTTVDHRFANYFSNSIRFYKEFDYGNKLNPVQVIIERSCDDNVIEPYSQKFVDFCAHLGKPLYKNTICVFDDEENLRLQLAKNSLKRTVDKRKFDHLFSELKKDYPNDINGITREVMESLQPMQDISPKKIFSKTAKMHGFNYIRCINGVYELQKVTKNNHIIKMIFFTRPFSSTISAEISISGYNFDLSFASLPEIIAKNEQNVEHYTKIAFEVADAIEKEYTETVFSSFGKTPVWYNDINN